MFSITLKNDVTVTQIDGRTVLFSKRKGDFFGLNDSAFELFSRLQAKNFDVVVEEAAAAYQVDPKIIREDLQSLVDELEKKRLIERVVTTK